jgi:ribonuclease R
LQLHADGYGFVIPADGGEDVFVPRRHVGEAHHGDTVAVRVSGDGRRGKLEGVIVGVLARADTRHLGVFRKVGRGGRVEPFESGHGTAFTVPPAFRHDARDGDVVEVEVARGGRGGPRARDAKVVRVLGPVDEPGVDVLVVALRHGLALQFPPEVLEEAARLPADPAPGESSGRERFDEPPAVTIDGETAQDFDDAVAIAPLPRGGFRLFVHIADVAHYVAYGSALDLEARARGTSVYFPGKVLPMFPERLSNDLCSLRPGRDRLVQSAILDLNASGEIRKVRFADGVIRSAARLTYGQVAAALDGATGHGVPESLRPMLDLMDRLREQLERRRRDRGSLDFDLPEPEILLDVEGAVTGVKIEPRNRAHVLIEEFMLAANEAVAGHLKDHGAPCLYRVHDSPDPVKLSALREFVEGLGLKPPGGKGEMSAAHLRKLLEDIAGRPEYPIVAQVVLRSMRQASYDTRNIGHFGLAAPVYCHFTSPIRRYPDLMVHRLLRASRRRRRAELSPLGHGLQGLAEASSTLERNAEAAERELLAWKTMVFMKGREGEELEGVVVGVTPFGLFVRLTETQVEGLLRVEELGDDRFDFVEGRMELRGRRTGRVIRLGQPLRVRIARVDTVLRRLDLARAGGPQRVSRRTQPASAKPARTARRPRPRRTRPRGR